MTKKTSVVLSALAATFAVGMFFSSAGGAEAKSIFDCRGDNRAKTVKCCEAYVRNTMPGWMRESGSTCQAAVSCTKSSGGRLIRASFAAAPKYRCTIHVLGSQGNGANDTPPPQRQQETPNEQTVD